MIAFVRMKAGFFDRKRIVDSMDKATLRALKEFGRLVRKRAQKSLQVAEGVSRPGDPPHIHKSLGITKTSKSTGRVRTQSVSPLREFLFFAYDKDTKSVVIGPAKLNKPGSLAALEKGGQSLILRRGKEELVNIAARPFMKPAFDAELPRAPRLWQNAMK